MRKQSSLESAAARIFPLHRAPARVLRGSLRPPALILAMVCALAPPVFADHGWQDPTPEELKMTSQPEVPGAAAVYLYREETADDLLHMHSIYVRLKVLTEKGKDYANVEVNYQRDTEVDVLGNRAMFSITDIAGRTIHSDGTVVPFAGTPYDKLISKAHGVQYQAKFFTMPDVQIGSIIEYRYKLRYDIRHASAPVWYIQRDLYLRKGRYHFVTTTADLLMDNGAVERMIRWLAILPPGAAVKEERPPNESPKMSLDVENILPEPDEEYMPPFRSLTYRVVFYYTSYATSELFWKGEGKAWSERMDKFIGPRSAISAVVDGLVLPSDTQEQKARKLYAAAMTIENTDFTREHTTAEDKAEGLGATKTAADVWAKKRGTSDQIAVVFVALARAAGMKAYAMAVTNRDKNIFNPTLPSWRQLDDDVAIVSVDGKEQFFDPGERYCPYGQMHWKHTLTAGVRQTDGGGTAFASTPSMPYTQSQSLRIADLRMDPSGSVAGIVKITWMGAPALRWRQEELSGDMDSVERDMESTVTGLLPRGMEAKVASVANMDDYEKPLTVAFNATGPVGAMTGKRLLIPSQLFQSNDKPLFPHEKREQPVYFPYPSLISDAVRMKLPPNMTVERAPQKEVEKWADLAAYQASAEVSGDSFLVRRSLALNSSLFYAKEYPELRGFYAKVADKDQEPVILKVDNAQASSNGHAQTIQAGANAKAN